MDHTNSSVIGDAPEKSTVKTTEPLPVPNISSDASSCLIGSSNVQYNDHREKDDGSYLSSVTESDQKHDAPAIMTLSRQSVKKLHNTSAPQHNYESHPKQSNSRENFTPLYYEVFVREVQELRSKLATKNTETNQQQEKIEKLKEQLEEANDKLLKLTSSQNSEQSSSEERCSRQWSFLQDSSAQTDLAGDQFMQDKGDERSAVQVSNVAKITVSGFCARCATLQRTNAMLEEPNRGHIVVLTQELLEYDQLLQKYVASEEPLKPVSSSVSLQADSSGPLNSTEPRSLATDDTDYDTVYTEHDLEHWYSQAQKLMKQNSELNAQFAEQNQRMGELHKLNDELRASLMALRISRNSKHFQNLNDASRPQVAISEYCSLFTNERLDTFDLLIQLGLPEGEAFQLITRVVMKSYSLIGEHLQDIYSTSWRKRSSFSRLDSSVLDKLQEDMEFHVKTVLKNEFESLGVEEIAKMSLIQAAPHLDPRLHKQEELVTFAVKVTRVTWLLWLQSPPFFLDANADQPFDPEKHELFADCRRPRELDSAQILFFVWPTLLTGQGDVQQKGTVYLASSRMVIG